MITGDLAVLLNDLMSFIEKRGSVTREQINTAFASDEKSVVSNALRTLELGGLLESTWAIKKKTTVVEGGM